MAARVGTEQLDRLTETPHLPYAERCHGHIGRTHHERDRTSEEETAGISHGRKACSEVHGGAEYVVVSLDYRSVSNPTSRVEPEMAIVDALDDLRCTAEAGERTAGRDENTVSRGLDQPGLPAQRFYGDGGEGRGRVCADDVTMDVGE